MDVLLNGAKQAFAPAAASCEVYAPNVAECARVALEIIQLAGLKRHPPSLSSGRSSLSGGIASGAADASGGAELYSNPAAGHGLRVAQAWSPKTTIPRPTADGPAAGVLAPGTAVHAMYPGDGYLYAATIQRVIPGYGYLLDWEDGGDDNRERPFAEVWLPHEQVCHSNQFESSDSY